MRSAQVLGAPLKYEPGNQADLKKVWCLEYFMRKVQPQTYIEFHAGAGVWPNGWEGTPIVAELKEQVTYCCPFFPGNKHFWMIPTAIIVSRDIKQYREPNLSSPMFDHMFDATYTLNNLRELNKVHKVMLGHGYTDFTLPSDGDNELAKFTVNLSNGDKLLMAGWIWYNK